MASYSNCNGHSLNTTDINVPRTQTPPTPQRLSEELIRDRMISAFAHFSPQVQLTIVHDLENRLLASQLQFITSNDIVASDSYFISGQLPGQAVPSTYYDTGPTYQTQASQDYDMLDCQDQDLPPQYDGTFRYPPLNAEHSYSASQAVLRSQNAPLPSVISQGESTIPVGNPAQIHPNQEFWNPISRSLQHNRHLKLSQQAVLNRSSLQTPSSRSSINSTKPSVSDIRWSGSSSHNYDSATSGRSSMSSHVVPLTLGVPISMPLGTSTMPRIQSQTTQPDDAVQGALQCRFGCHKFEFGRPGECVRHEQGCDLNPNRTLITCLLCRCSTTCEDPCEEKDHVYPYQYHRSDKVLEHLRKMHNWKIKTKEEKIPESWRWSYVPSLRGRGTGWACGICFDHLGTWMSRDDRTNIRNHHLTCFLAAEERAMKQKNRSSIDSKRLSIQSPPLYMKFERRGKKVVNYNEEDGWDGAVPE